MSEDQIIATITSLCALILIGSAVARRRLDQRSMLALIGIWVAIILAGMALAKLWIAHHS